MTGVVTLAGETFRNVSQNPINWAANEGWYIDLPTSGERVVVDPILRDGRVVVPSLVPNTNPCSAGGSSWLFELDFQSGGQLTVAPFDTDGDGDVDAFDTITSAMQLDGISSGPAVLNGFGPTTSPLENKYLNQSTGVVRRVLESATARGNRRMSWRQEAIN